MSPGFSLLTLNQPGSNVQNPVQVRECQISGGSLWTEATIGSQKLLPFSKGEKSTQLLFLFMHLSHPRSQFTQKMHLRVGALSLSSSSSPHTPSSTPSNKPPQLHLYSKCLPSKSTPLSPSLVP